MKTLNLVHPEKTHIKYEIRRFPDGQQNIVIEGFWVHYQETRTNSAESELIKVGSTIFNMHFGDSVQIKSRLNNWLDLELIVCAVASLRELGVEEMHLYTPYIMGARSDRKFEEDGNNYLKDVICPVINSLNFKTVTCIDPHSDVLEACIKGFRKESNLDLINWSLSNVYGSNKWIKDNINNFILVSPDAGASKKIYKIAEQIGYKGDIITCSKDRDADGKLTRTVVPLANIVNNSDKDFIIIDDICDGGKTFTNIAEIIKENIERYKGNGKIYLIVTHGIFSKDFEELSKYFDGIYCTNSYSDINNNISYWNEDVIKAAKNENFCKQLNVF